MRKEYIPLAVITALAAAAIYFFTLRPEPPPDAGAQGGKRILIPIYPIGPVSEPPTEFTWRSLKGVREYEVEVFDQGMTLIWAGKTDESALPFPAELTELLIGGEALFYQVNAKGRLGKLLLSSEPVLFRLSSPPNRGASGGGG